MNTECIMQLIVSGGNAKSLAMQAIFAAKEGDRGKAETLLKQSNDAIVQAHHIQTELLSKEASGEEIQLSLLMVHAQDHLMNAITVKDLAAEIVAIYQNK